MLDPSDNKAIITVSPYPDMACGDKLVMFWSGIDSEGVAYRHEVSRFVSETQVGRAIVFCVSAVHIAALDGGSLEVYYTLYTARLQEPVESGRLYLNVGDARPDLLPVIVNDAVGGTLDPDRVAQGARVTIRPYARMAAGDRVLLSWAGVTPQASFNDTLKIESFAVGVSQPRREDLTLTDVGVDAGDLTANRADLGVVVELTGGVAEAQVERLLLGGAGAHRRAH